MKKNAILLTLKLKSKEIKKVFEELTNKQNVNKTLKKKQVKIRARQCKNYKKLKLNLNLSVNRFTPISYFLISEIFIIKGITVETTM